LEEAVDLEEVSAAGVVEDLEALVVVAAAAAALAVAGKFD
jgi:hypothetical protein